MKILLIILNKKALIKIEIIFQHIVTLHYQQEKQNLKKKKTNIFLEI